jgi:Lrp/AsnC family leucine-responsive transcriptional regulator
MGPEPQLVAMHELDDTDLEILELLGEDARRPYSEIAERVGMSGPGVSDRVDRLREAGVLQRFTVDVDQSQLQGGAPVFVRIWGMAGSIDDVRDDLAAADAVEHVFVTADGECWFVARPPDGSVRSWLTDRLDLDEMDVDVTLLDDVDWTPSIGGTAFALSCAECGNTVDSEGERTTIDGDRYHFCCASCQEKFEDRRDRIAEGA